MANPYSRHVKRIPGRLYKDPTDTSLAAPYGGTPLGLARDVEFRPNAKAREEIAEEWGNQRAAVYYAGSSASLSCVLRELDDDALLAVLPFAKEGASGHVLMHEEPDGAGAFRAGTRLSSFALLFAPEAEDQHPWIYFPEAVAALDESAVLQASIGTELGIAVVFYALPKNGTGAFEQGMRGDLSV